MRNRRQIGNRGEDLAVSYLKKKGYRILEKNYRVQKGEIDIIAKDKNIIVFVEVKTRNTDQYGTPQESVDKRKQRQLLKLALLYLQKRNFLDSSDCRFDVISINLQNNMLEHIKDAFTSFY